MDASATGVRASQPSPVDLVEVDPSARGTSHAEGESWGITVSCEKGYLVACRAHLDTSLSAAGLYSLFNHPGGVALLPSRKKHSDREVLVTKPHYKEIRVIQTTKVNEIWRKRFHKSLLHLTEDARDPEAMRITFRLLESTFFEKFAGVVVVRPLRDALTGREAGSRWEVTQSVLPRGCPKWVSRIPLLGNVLRKTTLKHIKRVLTELEFAAEQVKAYATAHGVSELAALDALCGPTGECEEADGGRVQSFAFEPEAEDEGGEVEGGEGVSQYGGSQQSELAPRGGSSVGGDGLEAAPSQDLDLDEQCSLQSRDSRQLRDGKSTRGAGSGSGTGPGGKAAVLGLSAEDEAVGDSDADADAEDGAEEVPLFLRQEAEQSEPAAC